jgi:hypothetical protein
MTMMGLILSNLIDFGFVLLGFAIGWTLSKTLSKNKKQKKDERNYR